MRRILTSAAIVVFAGFAFAGCGDDDNGGDDTAGGTTGTTTATASGGETLTLVATDFAFDQTALTATAGEAVNVVIKNDGNAKHNLTIADLDVGLDAAAGESADETVEPEAGTYEYHCEYHPSAMKGTLTVS